MLHPAARVAVFAVLTVVFSACLTMLAGSIPESSINPPTPRPATATEAPTTQPTTAAPTQLAPTTGPEPTAAAGPPFPTQAPGSALVDQADVFSSATEELAARKIAQIARDHDATVVVYTQVKPGSTAATTQRDAIALKLKWRIGEGLVIMWNVTRPACQPGANDNAQIQLYADTRFATRRLSDLKRQGIYDDAMLPHLLACKSDYALLAALDAIATDIKPPPPPSSSRPPTSAAGVCADDEYKLSDFRWDEPFRWSFQESSVPDEYGADDVLEVLTRSVTNITDGRNDCGLPDRIDATATYVGTTREPPCESDRADGYNTVGFAELPTDQEEDTLAFVCPYGEREVVEADILINRDVPWALSEDDCNGFQELLEATMTHEFGHVFGLSHVSEETHGDLTMSPTSNGWCATDEISLGLGDILGLEELY